MININCFFLYYDVYNDNHICEKHRHPCTEIVFNEHGEGKVYDSNKSWIWGHNSIYIYQPGVDHWTENKTGGVMTCIGVSGMSIEKIPTGVFQANETLLNLFFQIQSTLKKNSAIKKERIELLTAMICLEFAENSAHLLGNSNLQPINLIREIIDTRFSEKISISKLASELYISKDYLRQVFKREYSMSPMQYMIQKRIENACQLLKQTNLNIKEISYQSGFDDPYYFSRLFKKIKGVSPSKFRQ